jgi:hypothetical protein
LTHDESETLKSCNWCGEHLPKKASFCLKCDNYVGWRGYLSGIDKTLAILVALVAVSGSLWGKLFPDRAALHLDIRSTEQSGSLFASVSVSNLGLTAGFVSEIRCTSRNDDEEQVVFTADLPVVIEPEAISAVEMRPAISAIFGRAVPKNASLEQREAIKRIEIFDCVPCARDRFGDISATLNRPVLVVTVGEELSFDFAASVRYGPAPGGLIVDREPIDFPPLKPLSTKDSHFDVRRNTTDNPQDLDEVSPP